MSALLDKLIEIFGTEQVAAVTRAIIISLLGVGAALFIPKRIKWTQIPPQRLFVLRKSFQYGVFVLTLLGVLHELGFDLGVLLGAAGIFTVAIGFASQTAASNLISGLFLMGEQPFGVGDTIRVAEVTGEVLSIDLLSVKIRTFDNLLVRIPNETMIKTNVTNLTRFPVRRLDMQIGVAYDSNISRVREVLFGVAEANPVCMQEPKPILIFLGYGDSSLNFQFSVWTATENFLELRNSMHQLVKEAFDREEIEIPFPHRVMVFPSGTPPAQRTSSAQLS